MHKRVSSALIGAWLLSNSAAAGAAIGLNLVPIAHSASALSVAISISGLGAGAAPSLAAYDLDLLFDAGLLAYVGTAFGDPALDNQLDPLDLGSNPATAALAGTGRLNLFELSLDTAAELHALQADSFTLAVVNFDVLANGSSELSLNVNALADANGDPLPANVAPTTITTVPLPPACAAMAAGLGLLYRRRA
ncbi:MULTISPECIES: cohesin domain-containing protein [Methylomonas]|uniref:PEP-CTERM protein-sorting domain-containing protein n=1 Tax=Methylomonas koyamae TaxID=702114 RepID=A0AA91DEK7_9GAMM|nr:MULTISPECIES: cohesin domain-containing protein [Methylomonas]ANE54014.1 hypothetical protein AYM39_01660 [Methylomonas sp. DH-1]OAI27528.1 hypothetical protein A1356_09315 [Methylomonas koyamae]